MRTIPSLDGLRAVAVLLVIAYHLHVPLLPEGRGVLTFFVLSGFLITWMMLNESERTGDFSLRNFYVRRVLRIFPALYVFLVVSIALRCISSGWPKGSLLHDYLSAFFYISNYRFALTPGITHTVQHTWALSVEEQFYLVWPWLFLACQRTLRRLTHLLIAVIVLINIYRMVLFFDFHVRERWLTYSFDTRADHILIGCLLAVLLKRKLLTPFWNVMTANSWISLVPFSLIIVSIAIASYRGLPYRFSVGYLVDPLLTAIFLVQVIAGGSSKLWGWLNSSIVTFLGKISYGMFLYHLLVNRLVLNLLGKHSLWIHFPVVLAVSVLFGTCSYYLIEIRFLRLKSKFTKQTSTGTSSVKSYQLRPLTNVPGAPGIEIPIR